MAPRCGWGMWPRSQIRSRIPPHWTAGQRREHFGGVGGKPSVLIIIFRQPGANVIETVDRVFHLMPYLQSSISPAIKLTVAMDRTVTVRASVKDIEATLIISIILVILVVFAFLRTVRATIIPSIAVPLSLVGTFGGMYLLGYSLDNLSLMALAISTGFVVDDAIVVLENITRYVEQGMDAVQAAFKGAAEIGFTVISMSTSLVAVFIPLLLMGGIVGRLFREFAVTLSIAIGVSLLVSLTTTPTMCAKFLRPAKEEHHNIFYRSSEWFFDKTLATYRHALKVVLQYQLVTFVVTILVACLTVYLYIIVPKGFFPQQDTGRIGGSVQAAQDISFQAMRGKMEQYVRIVLTDPAVNTVVAFAGGNTVSNQGRFFIMLKPLAERAKCPVHHFWQSCPNVTADDVLNRLRSKLAVVPGATLYLQSYQDLTIGGRYGNAQYQYTLQGEDLDELNTWAPLLLTKMRPLPELRDVNTDQQDKGLQAKLVIDRDTASRLGVAAQDIDNALYDAFGQRQVSTMYRPLNQYHVVMEVAPQFQQTTEALQNIYLRSSSGAPIPLAAFTHFEPSNIPLAVNHQGQFPSVTISFNLAPGISLGQATQAIQKAQSSIGFPATIQGSFQGTAAAFQDVASSEPILILDRSDSGLYRAGHALRKLHSPHHDSLDNSFRRAGRATRPAVDSQRTQRDRHHRNYLAHRPRKKECHYDDRRCPGSGTHAREKARRRDLRCLPPALPSYHDDDHGRSVGRLAAGFGPRNRLRTASSTGHHDCRRPDRQSGAHTFHYPSRVCLS